MRVTYYNSHQQRDEAKRSAHARGETMIHDDFVNISMQNTDGRTGKLTFGIPPNSPPRSIKGLNELNQLLKDKEIEYEDLLDLLTIQALKLNSTRWENFKALFGR